MTFLSSSLTCPASQSGLRDATHDDRSKRRGTAAFRCYGSSLDGGERSPVGELRAVIDDIVNAESLRCRAIF